MIKAITHVLLYTHFYTPNENHLKLWIEVINRKKATERSNMHRRVLYAKPTKSFV